MHLARRLWHASKRGSRCRQAPTLALPPRCRPCTYINQTTGTPTIATNSFTGENITCYAPQFVPTCNGNGDVSLPYGTAAYIGLGFTVFATLVVVELFGCDHFFRSAPSSTFADCLMYPQELCILTTQMPAPACEPPVLQHISSLCDMRV